jgi:RimJ/RimL family protein N-acetyltransferase
MKPVLETSRLLLRKPRPDDAQAIAAGLDNFNVSRFLNPVPHPYTEEMAHGWMQSLGENTPGNAKFVIEKPGTGLVGGIGLDTELGFWIAEPHWRNGYITEASVALLNWHFANTSSDAVPSAAHVDNAASQGVQQKLGFVVCGRKIQYSASRQMEVEHVVTSLTRDAFQDRGFLA